MPGAKVTRHQRGHGLTADLETDANGEYTAPSLPTGTYTITVEMTGFKTVALSDIELGVDQRVRIDLHAGGRRDDRVGHRSRPRRRSSRRPPPSSAPPSSSEQIKALPLNGRNFVSLTRTIPGVLRGIPGANIDGAGSLAWRASASFSANGQRPRDNNYMLDGVDNNETWLQTVVIFPSPDALDEFKMQTSTYSAEFGRSLGGVVNLQIKSGTNTFHGSAFEFMRNDAFDANNFFNNRAGRAEAATSSRTSSAARSAAPLIKDKTFFFGDYQGHRETQGQTFLSTVPSHRRCARATSRSSTASSTTRLTGQPFPGNIIPHEPLRPRSREHPDAALPRAEHGRRASARTASRSTTT